MKQLKKSRTLKWAVLFPSLLCSLIILIFYCTYRYTQFQNQIDHYITEQQRNLDSLIISGFTEYVNSRFRMLDSLITIVLLLDNNNHSLSENKLSKNINAYLKNYQKTQNTGWTFITNYDADLFFHSGEDYFFNSTPSYNIKESPWFKQALLNLSGERDKVFTKPYIDPLTNERVISSSMLSHDKKWIISIDLNLKTISNMMKKKSLSSLLQVWTVANDGTILSSSDPYQIGRTISDIGMSLNQKSFAQGKHKFNLEWTKVSDYFHVVTGVSPALLYKEFYKSLFSSLLLFGIGILTVLCVVFYALNKIQKMLYNMQQLTDDINKGNLEIYLEENSNIKELNQLSRFLNQLVDRIKNRISYVKVHSNSVYQQTKETQQKIDQGYASIQRSLVNITSISSAIKELSESSKEISAHINDFKKITEQGDDICQQSQKIIKESSYSRNKLLADIKQTLDQANSLQQLTNSIGQITDTIHSISEQTNLLALNASIESARAGDAGRGFSVVADEIRQLSQKTASATKTIQQTVQSIQKDVAIVSENACRINESAQYNETLSETTHQSFDELSDVIKVLNNHMTQILVTAQQQSIVTEDISEQATQTQQLSSDASNSYDEIQKINAKTEKKAQEVLDAVDYFQVKI